MGTEDTDPTGSSNAPDHAPVRRPAARRAREARQRADDADERAAADDRSQETAQQAAIDQEQAATVQELHAKAPPPDGRGTDADGDRPIRLLEELSAMNTEPDS